MTQGSDTASGLTTALDQLGSADGMTRHRARVALVTAGEVAVPTLVEALSDTRVNARWEAAKALNEIRDIRAIPALISALSDDGPGVRWLAADALANLGRAALEPVLHGLISQSGSAWFRDGAHHVLRRLSAGDLREAVLPTLLALESIEPQVGVLAPAHEALKLLAASSYGGPTQGV